MHIKKVAITIIPKFSIFVVIYIYIYIFLYRLTNLSAVGTFSASRDQFSRNYRIVDSLCSLLCLNKNEKITCSEKSEENIKEKKKKRKWERARIILLAPSLYVW